MRAARRYDAVVVGGGHNGLAAAAYLARAGRSCLLLERSEHLGGAAVSGELFPGVDARLSRYAYLVSLLPQRIVRELGLRIELVRRPVRSYTPDPRLAGTAGLLLGGAEADGNGGRSATLAAADAAARWRHLQRLTGRVARAVFPTLTEPLPSRSELARAVGDEEAWELIFERPVGEGVGSLLEDELLSGIALTDALIGTFASTRDPGLEQNRCFLYHVIGRCTGEWLVPVGGMGEVAAALARAAGAAGAELCTGAEVVAIEPSARAAGVRYEHRGARMDVSARHVLVGAAPAVLARLTGSPAPEGPEGSQLKVNMVLARLPRLRDGSVDPREAFAGTLHVNENADQLEAAFARAAEGEIPEPVPCEAYCHSLSDPSVLGRSLREAGAHTLTLFALHMPARLFRSDPAAAREAALAAVLRSLNGLLAEPVEGCLLRAPDGQPCLEASSPLDIERELAMPGGHIFHRPLRWPFAEDPGEAGTWGVETEHASVLLCGAGARRGGGISAIPGRNAAMAALAADPRPRRRSAARPGAPGSVP